MDSVAQRLSAVGVANALELRGVTRLFGALAALVDVSLTIRFGERRAGERQRDFKLPLLAVTQCRHQRVAHGLQMHRVQDRFRLHHGAIVGARTRQREASARDAAAGEIDVFAHGQPRKQQRDLVSAPQPAADALVRREGGDVLAEEADRAGGRREVAGDAVEERRLPGAVRAEHSAPLAELDRQRDVDERRERPEQASHAPELERVRDSDGGEALGDAIHGRRQPARPA